MKAAGEWIAVHHAKAFLHAYPDVTLVDLQNFVAVKMPWAAVDPRVQQRLAEIAYEHNKTLHC